jgi:hypothetical protein
MLFLLMSVRSLPLPAQGCDAHVLVNKQAKIIKGHCVVQAACSGNMKAIPNYRKGDQVLNFCLDPNTQCCIPVNPKDQVTVDDQSYEVPAMPGLPASLLTPDGYPNQPDNNPAASLTQSEPAKETTSIMPEGYPSLQLHGVDEVGRLYPLPQNPQGQTVVPPLPPVSSSAPPKQFIKQGCDARILIDNQLKMYKGHCMPKSYCTPTNPLGNDKRLIHNYRKGDVAYNFCQDESLSCCITIPTSGKTLELDDGVPDLNGGETGRTNLWPWTPGISD